MMHPVGPVPFPAPAAELPAALPVAVAAAHADADEADPAVPPKDWKERFCEYCNLLPGILLLAVNVMALALVLIYHNHYLAIPFAVGIALSFYMIYLSYQHKNLKAFGAQIQALRGVTRDLRSEVGKLQKTNVELQKTAGELRTEVDRARSEINRLAGQIDRNELLIKRQAGEIDRLEATNRDLSGNVTRLIAANARNEEQQRAEHGRALERIAALRALADDSSKLSEEQRRELGSIIRDLDGKIKTYEAQNARNEQNADRLTRSGALLSDLLSQFEQAFRSDTVRKLMDQSAELTRVTGALGEVKGHLEGLNREHAARIADLKRETGELERVRAALQHDREQAAALHREHQRLLAEHAALMQRHQEMMSPEKMQAAFAAAMTPRGGHAASFGFPPMTPPQHGPAGLSSAAAGGPPVVLAMSTPPYSMAGMAFAVAPAMASPPAQPLVMAVPIDGPSASAASVTVAVPIAGGASALSPPPALPGVSPIRI